MKRFTVKTSSRVAMIDITDLVTKAVKEEGLKSGLCNVFVPHTTAAVTINENADPDVQADLMAALSRLAPSDDKYRHGEGNADAHIKSSLIGSSATVIVEEGRLVLGTWQSVFLCEFDGPRQRNVFVKLLPAV